MKGRNITLFAIIFTVISISTIPYSIQTASAPGAWGGQDLYHVPLSWCALVGSPATDASIGIPNNVFSGGDDFALDDKLWRRHERVTEFMYQTPAGISFRSGINNHLILDFPIIADPNSYGMLGATGDIRGENPVSNNPNEYNAAINGCRNWWSMISPTGGVNGLTAINVRLFVDGMGNVVNIIGWGGCAENMMGICSLPYSGSAMVVDNFFMYPGLPGRWNNDPLDQLLGHELGHALSLNHRSDNTNALMFPSQQDTNADGLVDNTVLTTAEINQARLSALQVPGLEVDPVRQIIQGDIVSSRRSDKVQEEKLLKPFEDISSTTITLDKKANTVAFGQELFGVLPNRTEAPTQYWTLADIDNNTETGASRQALNEVGFLNTTFQGADLIIKAEALGGYTVNGSAWKVSGNDTLDIMPPPAVRFEIQNMMVSPYYALDSGKIEIGREVPVYSIVNAILDNGKVDLKLGIPIRIQSIVTQEDGTKRAGDKLDDSQDERGQIFVLEQTPFPHCFPDGDAVPGKELKVSVEGLLPNSTIHGLLGGTQGVVFREQLDSTGNKTITFLVPENATQGFHLMTVGVDNTAFTADCAVTVKSINATVPTTQQTQ